MQFDREVTIDSFWIRLHRSDKAWITKSEGTRTVQVFNNSVVVAETTFLLRSDEWILVKPASTAGNIIGDTLMVQAGTDIDSIVVSWGDQVKFNKALRKLQISNRPMGKFQSFKVVENEKHHDYGYSLKLAHNIVQKGSEIQDRP